MQTDDSKVAPMYIGSNDRNVKGVIDFCNVETLMLLYPTILWLQLMKKETIYARNEMMSKFVIHRGTVELKGSGRKNYPCQNMPTWLEIIGTDEVLAAGITQYLINDTTPNIRHICPTPPAEQSDIFVVPLKEKKQNIVKVINSFVVDLHAVHSTTQANSLWYTHDRRVMVDHLLQVIKVICTKFSLGKANNMTKLDLIWRVCIYFRVIFDLMAYTSHESYMNIIRQDSLVESILCQTSGTGGKMAYYTVSVSELNALFVAKFTPAMVTGFLRVFNTTPEQKYKRIAKLSIIKGAVTEEFSKHVGRLVRDECTVRKARNTLDIWYFDSDDETYETSVNDRRHTDTPIDFEDSEDEIDRELKKKLRKQRKVHQKQQERELQQARSAFSGITNEQDNERESENDSEDSAE